MLMDMSVTNDNKECLVLNNYLNPYHDFSYTQPKRGYYYNNHGNGGTRLGSHC